MTRPYHYCRASTLVCHSLPLERDCGGQVPEPFSTVLGQEVGRKYITRKERAVKLGLQAPDLVEEEKVGGKEVVTIDETDVYNIVSESDSFDCPMIEEVEKGLGDLWLMMDGQWKAKKKRVDVVWLNLPLPGVVVEEEKVARYDFKAERYWESNKISDALNLSKDLLTSAGVLVVVAPAGFPSDLLSCFSLGATAVAAELRAVVTLIYEAKKAKVSRQSLAFPEC